MKKVIILGDSLSLPRPMNFYKFNPFQDLTLGVEFNETYPFLLQMYLKDYYVINRAVRASTIKQIYMRDRSDHIFLTKPDVVILHVGIVDLWPRVELGGRSYLNEGEFSCYYIKLLKEIGIFPETKIICIGIVSTSEAMNDKYPGVQANINKFNNILKNICALNAQAVFIDASQIIPIELVNKYLMKDAHHLNPEGNDIIAKNIIEVIEGNDKINYHQFSDLQNEYIHLNIGTSPFNQVDFFNLDSILLNEKVIIYGAGELGKKIYSRLANKKVYIKAFIDNKIQGILYGIPITKLEECEKCELVDIDKIIIASFTFKDEMLSELDKLGISDDKIVTYVSDEKEVSIKKLYEMIEV
ncbi:SGNH/GDSL hydrolase family protein [Psychrobacillus psychrodurans]|uniref:SGNH/GDSL hydrolase family protein n=1 Tax=Psychrobacillus psychrodurans TaxID=126157 RepID=A0A9X3R928_9BACI|nr:SGNH/GDSL hydrolase family protein [Psychrobacillus psychrodurans]MCZ8531827.1 SGNH/GDSL hydrolase family protein [Psychrobacillus psychrodurans]